MKKLGLIVGLFLGLSVAHAATNPSESETLVNNCESGRYFFLIPFVSRSERELLREEFKSLLSEVDIFEFDNDGYSTVAFSPKQGAGLNRREIVQGMKALLQEVEPLVTTEKTESGGIFCITTSGLPD